MRAWRPSWMVLAVALALLVSLLAVTPALAEDPPPPADPPPIEVAAGEGLVPAAEATPIEEPVTEAPPEAAPAEQSTEPVPPTEPPAPPTDGLLTEVPDGTTVAVVGDAGEVLPLASAEAAEVLATGDPIWCPASVATPVDGASGCTPSFPEDLPGLLAYLAANEPSVDGVIWIEKGYDSDVHDPGLVFELNGASFVTWDNYKLTIQGGWDGLGTNTIVVDDPSEINAHVWITNWGNDVTLNDIVIDGAVGQGLNIDTTGMVTLNRVKVTASGAGASIDNTSGAADVIVSSSEFSGAGSGTGLVVYSNGAITLTNVLAELNDGHGVWLDNDSAPTPKNVSVSSTTGDYDYRFADNGESGLVVYSFGAIQLKDVTSVGNLQYGAYVDNTAGTGAISLTGVNIFSENGADGLIALSHGAISASNLVGNVNGGWGAYLSNTAAPVAAPVTLSGFNEFKYSAGGLYIGSIGTITLSNLIASESTSGGGVSLDNVSTVFAGDVKATGYLSVSDNFGDGLAIHSRGAITLANVTANNNGFGVVDGMGAYLDNSSATVAKAITLSGANAFNGNHTSGLLALSRGAITVSKLTANWNEGGAGAVFDTIASGAATPQKVTLSGYATVDDNYGDGLGIYGYGAIAVANLTARWNGGTGADLSNWRIDAFKPMAVNLSGSTTIEENASDGLVVNSLGAISVNNLRSGENGGLGTYFDNDYPGAKGAVTVNGTSEFWGNDSTGLEVHSLGSITIKDFDSYQNGGYGVFLNNADFGAVGNVVVGTTRANWCNGLWANGYSGMEIYSLGAVTLSNLCADANGIPGSDGYGTYVNNEGAATPKPVTLKGSNRFDDNYSGGLSVEASGAIVGSNLEAYDNTHGSGVNLDNTVAGPAAPQNVTLTGFNEFGGNSNEGLVLQSFGVVSLSNLYADENGSHGLLINNGGGTPKAVTVSGYVDTSNNGGYGLYVYSSGAIKVANLDSYSNVQGARLYNADPGSAGGITLTGYLYTSGNDTYGLNVYSLGAITFTLTDSWAGDNLGEGWTLDNQFASTPQPVKLTVASGSNIDFWNNGSHGILINSKGAITVTSLDSGGNGLFGAKLTNNFPGASGGVTLSGQWSGFNENTTYGLLVESVGPISVKVANGLDAWTNGWYGVRLDNTFGTGPITIGPGGIWGSTFGDNGNEGLILRSRGAITLTDVEANGNGSAGADVDNTASGSLTPQNVTLNTAGGFFNNQASGLLMRSYGAITVSNLVADNNGLGGSGFGADLDNYVVGGGPSKPITLNGTNRFTSNSSGGLEATSLGAIKANNLTAGWNDGDGAYLDNQWGVGSLGGVTLTGTSDFSENVGVGLLIYSHGAITLNNITANYNGDTGAYVKTWGLAVNQVVKLTGTNSFNGNGDTLLHAGNGLEVWADGQIAISNITANWNAENGAYLDGIWYDGVVIPLIDLTGTNMFSWNYYDGLYLHGEGTALLDNVTADENGGDGIHGDIAGDIYVCRASLTNNTGYGWFLGPYFVTVAGVNSHGNGLGPGYYNDPYVFDGLYVRRSCP